MDPDQSSGNEPVHKWGSGRIIKRRSCAVDDEIKPIRLESVRSSTTNQSGERLIVRLKCGYSAREQDKLASPTKATKRIHDPRWCARSMDPPKGTHVPNKASLLADRQRL